MKTEDFFKNFTETSTYTFADVIAFINKYFTIVPSAYSVGSKRNTKLENQNSLTVLLYAAQMNYTIEQCLGLYAEHHLISLTQPNLKKHRNIFQLQKIYRKLIKNNYDTSITIKTLSQPLASGLLQGAHFIHLPTDSILPKVVL